MKILPGKKFLLIVAVFTFIGMTGCASRQTARVETNLQAMEKAEWVAVLPFETGEGITEKIETEKLLRKSFYENLSYLGYLDRDIHAVDKKLKEIGLYNPKVRNEKISFQELGELLGADYLVAGTIQKVVNFTGLIYSETSITAKLKMIEAKTGKVVWEKEHKEAVRSSIAMPDSAVTAFKKQKTNANCSKAYALVAEKFAKKVVESIIDPTPNLAKGLRLPEIKAIDVKVIKEEGTGNSVLKVAMVGDPKMEAVFDIGSWKTNVPMTETRPGRYEGTFGTQLGDFVEACLIVGKLTGENGITGTRVYRKELIRLGRLIY